MEEGVISITQLLVLSTRLSVAQYQHNKPRFTYTAKVARERRK